MEILQEPVNRRGPDPHLAGDRPDRLLGLVQLDQLLAINFDTRPPDASAATPRRRDEAVHAR